MLKELSVEDRLKPKAAPQLDLQPEQQQPSSSPGPLPPASRDPLCVNVPSVNPAAAQPPPSQVLRPACFGLN